MAKSVAKRSVPHNRPNVASSSFRSRKQAVPATPTIQVKPSLTRGFKVEIKPGNKPKPHLKAAGVIHPVLAPDGHVYEVPENELDQAINDGGGQILTSQEFNRMKSETLTVPDIVKNQASESWLGLKNAVGGKMDSLGKQSSLGQLLQPAKDVAGLFKSGLDRIDSAGTSAIDTVKAAPDVLRTAVGVGKELLRGKSLDSEYNPSSGGMGVGGLLGGVLMAGMNKQGGQDAFQRSSENLERVTQGQKEAVRGVAEFIPTPASQFASGMQRNADNMEEKNLTLKEGLTRGIVGGTASAVASAPIIPMTKGLINKSKSTLDTVTGKKSVDKIAEILQPKANAKEIKLAMAENRYTTPDTSKWFGRKEATLAPSKDVIESAKTIASEIDKNAHTWAPEKLKQAADKKVQEISTELRPQLAKVNLDDQLKEQMMDKFLKVKEELTSDVNFMNKASGKDILKAFEDNFMMKALDAKNLDELWDLRIKLDKNKSIAPKSARDATELSEQYLKDQQEAWHALRNIFGNTIKDAEIGLSSNKARGQFKKLKDLINAKNYLVQKSASEFKKKSGLTSKRNLAIGGLGLLGTSYLGSLLPKGE